MATTGSEYDFRRIEATWQQFWDDHKTFQAAAPSAQPKFYVLDMFPYPSGAGLHLGHCENYAITDIMARYQRARGRNVLYPIGWDAFGLPTENYAIKTGRHPAEVTQENITNFRRQLKSIGVSYDFSREVDTTDPKYVRWTQWIWLQLFRRNLAYVQDKPVWWCPALGTVLANEEVIDGRSEVGSHPVERRPVRQWVLRITAYAERLLAGLADLDWPDSTKRMQAAWIGRSEGCEVDFALDGLSSEKLRIFTTRPDTLFGCTYMVIAPEHPLVDALTTAQQRGAVADYQKTAAAKSDLERTDLAKSKTGVFTGRYAINPVNNQRVPVWVADYVVMGYGTGAIMAVPGQDQRDWDFAKTYNLPIIRTVQPPDGFAGEAFVEDGAAINSANDEISLNGLDVATATARITAWLEQKGLGQRKVNYKLRDWLFSRQRYWGEPFPLVWVSESDYHAASSAHGDTLLLPATPVTSTIEGEVRYALPIPESALPLELPTVKSYQPAGTGESPLAAIPDWLEIWYQPSTGAAVSASESHPGADWIRARRETNTMPQWAGSCWYYLRYIDPHNDRAIASPEALAYWGMPDLYVGGAEHAVLHLLYARFWHMVLHDLGVVRDPEPFKKLFHQGIILGEDGEKMSKSRGNVANPDDVIRDYGTDTLRMYLMFLGPLEAMKPWSMKNIEGVHRFLRSVWREVVGEDGGLNPKIADGPETDAETERLLHAAIKKVTDDIENLRYNTAIPPLMVLRNHLQKAPRVSRPTLRAFLQLLQPFAPHIASELWDRLGEKEPIHTAPWPVADESKLISDTVKVVIQVNGKTRADVMVAPNAPEAEVLALAQSLDRVRAHLDGKAMRKVIYVPGRILNLVVG